MLDGFLQQTSKTDALFGPRPNPLFVLRVFSYGDPSDRGRFCFCFRLLGIFSLPLFESRAFSPMT